jgi:hypothetical protein
MRITNHQAFQGHPVPTHVYYAAPGEIPLDYEILEEPEMVYEEGTTPISDDLDEDE